MARAILSCLGIGVAAAAATAGAAHLSADPSLMFAAGSALGGVAGNLGTDLFKILNRSVAERWLEGRSGIDENHHIAQALRLAQMRGLQVVCDRFDSVWPGDNDELRRAIAENFSDQLREFLSVEIAAAAKPGFPAALMRDTEERKLRAEVLIGLPNAFGETLAVRRAGNEETGLLERQHQIRNMVERAVLAEISLSVAPSERKLPPTFIAAFEGAGFADSWFDLFIRDAADRLVPPCVRVVAARIEWKPLGAMEDGDGSIRS